MNVELRLDGPVWAKAVTILIAICIVPVVATVMSVIFANELIKKALL